MFRFGFKFFVYFFIFFIVFFDGRLDVEDLVEDFEVLGDFRIIIWSKFV